jgi:DNA-binding LacI/PurR family transcriptional regulator
MTTLQDVAQRAGVSIATVSKVLSNTPYVSKETRRKVLRAIAELDYVPNLAARALSSGKTRIITVVFPIVYDPIFSDPLTMSILEGIELECRARGYNILLSTPRLTVRGADAHYRQLIRSGYMDGVIAIDNVPMGSVLEPVQRKGIPGVAIGYHPVAHFVRSDDRQGGQLLMEHIIGLGHRRIGLVSVPEDLNFSIPQRLEGMRTAAEAAGLDFGALPVQKGDFSVESGAQAAAELLGAHPNLTALIVLNDRMAMGAIQQARALGYAVPGRLSVVGYDDIPAAATFAPPLTTVCQQAPELGRAAARMLFALLDKQNPEPVSLPTHLVIRQSSAVPYHAC